MCIVSVVVTTYFSIRPLPYGGEGVNKAGVHVIAFIRHASQPPSLEYQSVRTINKCRDVYGI